MAFEDNEESGYSKPVEEGKTYRVKIEDLGSKGDGIARKEGFVIFVPDTEVGEQVEVEINSVGRRFAFGEVLERGVEVETEEEEQYEEEEVEEEPLEEELSAEPEPAEEPEEDEERYEEEEVEEEPLEVEEEPSEPEIEEELPEEDEELGAWVDEPEEGEKF